MQLSIEFRHDVLSFELTGDENFIVFYRLWQVRSFSDFGHV